MVVETVTGQAPLQPLVTVGMPVRNGEPYFRRALECVLAQDYPSLEVVVSDNGSNDGTSDYLREIVAQDHRVRVVRQEQVLSAFENFAWVMRQARGDYFLWAAHDDLRPVNYVSSLVWALASNPTAVLAFGDLRVSAEFAGNYRLKRFDYQTAGRRPFSRMRRAAYQQCYHIYGVWRLDKLRRIPFIFNAWWPDLPLMVAAASLGEFVRVPGVFFDYLEIPKTNEQRALYQDNQASINRVARTLKLFRVTFDTVRGVSGRAVALAATWFVIEKQFWVVWGLLTGKIRRGDY